VIGVGALLGAELRRFFSRRVLRGAFALGIALTTLILVIQTARSEVSTESQSGQSLVCTVQPNGPTATPSPNPGLPPGCTPQFTTSTVTHDRRLNISRHYSESVGGVGVAMVIVAFVIGASFVGAEFGAGSLSTQLIFEPRRTRVIAVKAIAVGIGLALTAVALLVYLGLLMFAGSELRGLVHGLDATWFAARAGDLVRVAGAVALAGIVAYAITVVARRTVAAVAGLLIGQVASGLIGSRKDWHWVAKYNPATTLIIMAIDPLRHAGDNEAQVLHLRGAIATSCAWAMGLTIVGAVIFNRREVR
jgi:ABC-2 type transport system permease protein